ncbi:MAG: hypothetical protein ABJA78_16765 [Ferruginibacter sp.]
MKQKIHRCILIFTLSAYTFCIKTFAQTVTTPTDKTLALESAASSEATFPDAVKTITPDTPPGCISGDCKNGQGIYLSRNDKALRIIRYGSFDAGALTGFCTELVYKANPGTTDKAMRLNNILKGNFKGTQFQDGFFTNSYYSLRDGELLTASSGSSKNGKFMGPGSTITYTPGSKGSQYILKEGDFIEGSVAGTLTVYGYKEFDGIYKLRHYTSDTCLDGNCRNGSGKRLNNHSISIGKFSDERLLFGEILIYSSSDDGLSNGFYHIRKKHSNPNNKNSDFDYLGDFTPLGASESIEATMSETGYHPGLIQTYFKPKFPEWSKVSPELQNWLSVYNTKQNAIYDAQAEERRQKSIADYEKAQQPGYYGNTPQQPAQTNAGAKSQTGYKVCCPVCNCSGKSGQGYYTTVNGTRVFERPRCITCSGTGYITKY